MYLFKTSGQTYDSVVTNQKHAFRGQPREWYSGEIVLVSKNKKDCMPTERQIGCAMRFYDVRKASDAEIESYWPGNSGRWKYIVDCVATEPIQTPFNLDEILGDEAKEYEPIMTFKKIKKDHEALILPFLNFHHLNSTDEIASLQKYSEGAVCSIIINAYERDLNARAACIEHFGLSCKVCGFNFQEKYGQIGSEYIHVHHIVPLADIGKKYEVNPITDMIPLCANCHAMVHRRRPALTITELLEGIKGKNQ